MFAQLVSGLDFQAHALVVRAQRQQLIASNIANADTPGYAARDINFRQAMASASGQQQLAARGTLSANAPAPHPAHIALGDATRGTTAASSSLAYTVQTQPTMDNNSVDLDRERASFVDNAIRYESTLRFINGYSKTILSAIQGQ